MSCNSCSTYNPCNSYPNAQCVYYTGASLSCTGVKTNDRLDIIIQKMDTKICSVVAGQVLYTDNTNSITHLGEGTESSPLMSNVNISGDADNIISIHSDGLYAPSTGLIVSFTSIFEESN